MQNGDQSLTRTDAIPDEIEVADFITKCRYVLVRDNCIDGILTGNVLKTCDGQRFLKFEQTDESALGTRETPLLPGAYIEVAAGATLREHPQVVIKPGLHRLSSIVRLCHRKDLRGINEALWKSRARLVALIADCYDRLEAGVYKIGEPSNAKTIQRIEISDEQANRLNQFLYEKFVSAHRTSPIDRHQMENAVSSLYRIAGLQPPRVVIVGSPLVGAISAGLASAILEFNSDGTRAISSTRAGLLNDPLRRILQNETGKDDSAWPSNPLIDWRHWHLLHKLAQDLDMLIGPSSHDWQPSIEHLEVDIENAVYAATVCDTTDKVLNFEPDASVAPDCTDESLDLTNYDVKERLARSCAAKLSAGNQSFEDLMLESVRRVDGALTFASLSDQLTDWLAKEGLLANTNSTATDGIDAHCDTISRQCNRYWLHERFCIVSEHPQFIKLDQHGQVHCDDGPAILWRDGLPQYFIHGISVTRQVVEQPQTIPASRILNERNLEVRRVMIQRYGESKFLVDSGAHLIHEDECGALYRQDLDGDEALQMVCVTNSTPEPDGTFKRYYLRVPPEVTTAKEGVAWTFGLSSQEYEPAEES